MFFTDKPVHNFEDALKCDTEFFFIVWKRLLADGVYWPPSQFEACFLSIMHSKSDLKETVEAFDKALKKAKSKN